MLQLGLHVRMLGMQARHVQGIAACSVKANKLFGNRQGDWQICNFIWVVGSQVSATNHIAAVLFGSVVLLLFLQNLHAFHV